MFTPLKQTELLSKMTTGGGLQVLYRFTRTPHLFAASMTSVELTLNNLGQEELTEIKIGSKTLSSGMAMHEFPGIAKLAPGASQTVSIGINFNDSTQAAKFDIVSSGRAFSIQFQAPVGELIRAVSMPAASFDQERSKLRGMNEVGVSFSLPDTCADEAGIKKKIYEVANVLQVPNIAVVESEAGGGSLNFAGQTTAAKCLVLVTLKIKEKAAELTINCEKIVIGSMLAKELKTAFEVTK
jgi:AP-3 complex subunit beta